jgi:cytochrome c biogenesis protein
VYQLDTSKMRKIGLESIRPGQTWALPQSAGSVEFTGFERWASFQIAYDPGKELALLAAAAAIAGLMLSLFVKRRRIWVKVRSGHDGGTLIGVAGLSKNENAELPDEVSALATHLGQANPQLEDDRA